MHVRSNHALEHATLHVLQEHGTNVPMGGISDAGGFWIYGEVDTETILEAAREALGRLAAGESDLAVHPNCGTNIAVGAVSAGVLAWLAMRGTQGSTGRRLRRMPVAVLMGMFGYRMAQPLGPKGPGADHYQSGCDRTAHRGRHPPRPDGLQRTSSQYPHERLRKCARKH